MTRSTILLLLLACGPKNVAPVVAHAIEPMASEASGDATVSPTTEAALEEIAEPEPEPEPEPVVNADLNMSFTFADGTTRSGHVIRIERSADFYGESEWLTDAGKLTLEAETSSDAKDLEWTEVRSISVRTTSMSDVSCTYDSDFTPWMYDCTMKIPSTLIDTSGKKWTVENFRKWRFTFDDDSSVELWLKKYPSREQDSQVVTLDTVNPQNMDLYAMLQQRLREQLKTQLVVKISVN